MRVVVFDRPVGETSMEQGTELRWGRKKMGRRRATWLCW